jgi:hypothetical protein
MMTNLNRLVSLGQLRSRPARRRLFPRPILIALTALLVISALAFVRVARPNSASGVIARAASMPPANLFMQSVIDDNGALGWHQLCPSTQVQVSESALVKQANAERAARAQQGLTLTLDFIGARPRPSGGELRVYIVTGHWPNGTTQMSTYSVLTQPSGCVEDAKNQ